MIDASEASFKGFICRGILASCKYELDWREVIGQICDFFRVLLSYSIGNLTLVKFLVFIEILDPISINNWPFVKFLKNADYTAEILLDPYENTNSRGFSRLLLLNKIFEKKSKIIYLLT